MHIFHSQPSEYKKNTRLWSGLQRTGQNSLKLSDMILKKEHCHPDIDFNIQGGLVHLVGKDIFQHSFDKLLQWMLRQAAVIFFSWQNKNLFTNVRTNADRLDLRTTTDLAGAPEALHRAYVNHTLLRTFQTLAKKINK